MRALIASIFLMFCMLSQAADTVSLKNQREGESYYTRWFHDLSVKKVLKKVSQEKITSTFQKVLAKTDPKKLCSYTLLDGWKAELSDERLNVKGLIYVLRRENHIDDVVARLLLKAHKVQSTGFLNKDEEDIFYPIEDEITEKLLEHIANFDKKFIKDKCLDEGYRTYFAEFAKIDKKFKSLELEGLNRLAWKKGKISAATYLLLEQARLNDLENTNLTLQSYYQKISSLRNQYPLRDVNEKSEYVTQKVKKLSMSHRQKLLESYSDMQIILMANLVKTLRSDLDSGKMELLVYDKNGEKVERTRELKAMGRFFTALDMFRADMTQLSTNSYFDGRAPDFLDLITASYEIGLIPASEVDALVGLEEVWNPKKTIMEKAMPWIKTFSSVASLALPPPYGFIPALAIVVIEATSKKTKSDIYDPTRRY